MYPVILESIEHIPGWLVVFAATFALDFVWAYYTQAIQKHKALAAASWAAGIMVLGGVAQFGYINDPILLIPAAAGAAAGTYVAVRRHDRVNRRKSK